MTAIHIEPAPPRTSPGAILAFICNATKLDRMHVGKIAVLGRGVTVDSDAKAAAVVQALDGAEFQGRPVRVRFAGKADFSEGDHFAHLSRLLDLEAASEAAEARRRAQEDRDCGDGTTLTALVLRDTDAGLGGRLLLSFGRTNRKESLPPNRLGPGSPVVLTQTKVNRGFNSRGIVFDRTETTLGVAIEPPDEEIPDDATWRLDLTPDEVSRLRQQDALRRASAAKGDRLAHLRAVLLGEREAEFERGPVAVLPDHLNSSQREAIEFALAAKDVAVIHGPPGTGKTTTVAELIRQAAARGDRILACAASNHAVDNLLDKLLRLGEEPVRLGHPARVEPELRGRALDILADKHADARQARKVAREASALFRQADKWARAKPEPGAKAALRREARELLAEARKLETLAIERILDDARIVCATLSVWDDDKLPLELMALQDVNFDLSLTGFSADELQHT